MACINDFRFMRCGRVMGELKAEQAYYLAPVAIQTQKKERALLLLHGFSSSPAVYRELIPRLRGYDALFCPCLPGHGESLSAFAAIKSSDWLSAAEHACSSLVNEYQQLDVMGLSLGGLLACHLSQRFSLHHLYLLAPALDLRLNLALTLVAAKLLKKIGFRQLRNRAGNLQTEDAYELAYRQLPLSTIIELLSLVQNFHFIPPKCPSDVFLGAYDKVVHTQQLEKRFGRLPQVNLHHLAHSAHVLPLDADLGEIIACVNGHQK